MTPLRWRRASPAEIQRWDEIVDGFPNGRLFHSLAWLQAVEASTTAKLLYLVLESTPGSIVGALPGFLRRIGPFRIFGSPLPGLQTESLGPAFDGQTATTASLIDPLIPFLEREYGTHQIEICSRSLDHAAMEAAGFQKRPLFTYRIPLSPGDEATTFGRIRPRTRTYIRKAAKDGLRTHIASDESFVDEFYDQVREVFLRRGSSVPFPSQRVRELFRRLQPSGRLIAVAVDDTEGNHLATGFLPMGRGEVFLWGWAHRTRHGSRHPVETLLWIAMKAAMDAGCTVMDMCGGGTKLKYGAQPDHDNFLWSRGRYAWIAPARTLAERAYRLQQRLRGRLARKLHGAAPPAESAADDSSAQTPAGGPAQESP